MSGPRWIAPLIDSNDDPGARPRDEMDDRQQYAIAGIAIAVWSSEDREFENKLFTPDEFADALREYSIAEYVTDADLARFIDYSVSNDIATLVQTPYARPRVRFSPSGIYDHAKSLEQKNPLALAVQLGLRWVVESLQNIKIKPLPTERLLREPDDSRSNVPAELGWVQDPVPDDVWEPLPLDRESSEFKEAMGYSDFALDQIASNNGYAATEPEERNGIVETIRGTIKAIWSGFPSRSQIHAGLIAPLKFIVRKFGDAAMGEAAKQALIAIATWLAKIL